MKLKTNIKAGDQIIGEISLLPYNYPMKNLIPCNGQELPINNTYAELYYFLEGYKPDRDRNATTFRVPDLNQKADQHGAWYYISLKGYAPERV